MQRILITGAPNTGKTYMAVAQSIRLGCQLFHTDDLIEIGWSEASGEVAKLLGRPGPWIIEGVAVPRAIRKWLKTAGPMAAPCDRLIVLRHSWAELTPGQQTMAKGVATVLAAVLKDARVPRPEYLNSGDAL